MKISVVVCTYNRCEDLRRALQSLILQDFPASDYEILVVDNNSKDGTKGVVSEFTQVRYVLEEKIGLSYARNRGIEESRGDIVAFIDDDARADKEWLKNFSSVYIEDYNAGCVGGRVIADWRGLREPSWWHPALNSVSKFQYSSVRTTLKYPYFPIGTNISFRKDSLVRAGMFNPVFGRNGTKMLACEETDICLKIQEDNQKIFYEPNAIVYHIVDGKRMNREFIRNRAYWEGRSRYLLEVDKFGNKYVNKRSMVMVKDILSCIPGIFIRRIQNSLRIPGRKFVLMEQLIWFLLGYLSQRISIKNE